MEQSNRSFLPFANLLRGAFAAPQPTIFHVTHWKAGSQWVYKILREAAVGREIVQPHAKMEQFTQQDIIAGAIYPTVYVDRETFLSVSRPPNSRHFVVIRDLRDTLVSAYFSLRYSHAPMGNILDVRTRLEGMSLEEGLLWLMQKWLPPCARIQKSWLDAGEDVIKYEDMLTRDFEIFSRVLIDRCELPVRPKRLKKVIENSRFEQLSNGRSRGTEDVMEHTRKGVSGDWINHFTPLVCAQFNELYAPLLERAGYQVVDL